MRAHLFFLLVLTILFGSCEKADEEPADGRINDFNSLINEFENPGPDYRSAPFWVWNNDVDKEDIDRTLKDFKDKGIDGVFLHPRYGMMIEYLSDEWFGMVAYAMEKAKELDMRLWIYDENSYPSGFAGGHVPDQMPESYKTGVSLKTTKTFNLDLIQDCEDVKYVFKKEGDNWVDITSGIKEEEGKEGEYMIFDLVKPETRKWYAGFAYVDLLMKGVTEKFIDTTMKGYEKVLGNEFGNIVPGIFTDEPNISAGGSSVRWTPDLFNRFKEMWGYDLEPVIISLVEETGDWRKIRHNYQSTLLDMFIERWSKPWNEYTEKHNLKWTGHYWEHGWPAPYHGPDNMAMYAYHQVPAIDMLFNMIDGRPDQFGNNVAVKELASVANQFERHRTLSETYGGAGWELRFEDMKRLGDWEYVLGVNFLNQHLAHISLAGDRKHDYPQSFGPYASYWPLYEHQADYFARLSVALSSGRQVNRILVLEPTTTAWMYFNPGRAGSYPRFDEIKTKFHETVNFLEEQQVEYDLGSEDIIRDHGSIKGKKFVVNKRSYDLVVVPDAMDNFDKETIELVKQFLARGGNVLQIGEGAKYVDGIESSDLAAITRSRNWIKVTSLDKDVVDKYMRDPDLKISASPFGECYHHRRKFNDGELIFFTNFSLEEGTKSKVTAKGASVEGICPHSGKRFPIGYKKEGDKLVFPVELDPAGSYMVYIHNDEVVEPSFPKSAERELVEPSDSSLEMLNPNVLTVDYLWLKFKGEASERLYYAEAKDKIYKHFGFEDGNPWFMSSQFKTEILDKNKDYEKGDRFDVFYSIEIDPGVSTKGMKLVIERPWLYTITLNDKEITTDGSEYWLDPDFHVFDVSNK